LNILFEKNRISPKGIGIYNTTTPAEDNMTTALSNKTAITQAPITLSPAQDQAINEFDRPVLLISPPGTGKTMIVTRKYKAAVDRWGHGSAIAITFTKKAANEVANRLAEMRCPTFWTEGQDPARKHMPTTGTFHAIANRILALAAAMDLYDGPTIYASNDEIERALNDAKLGQKDMIHAEPWLKSRSKDNLRSNIDRTKNAGYIPVQSGYASLDDEMVEVVNELPNPGSLTQSQMVRYQESLERQKILDYDDAIIQATLMLAQHRNQILPFLKAVIVDEYQDSNSMQERFIQELSKGLSLTCCGDDDQAIYRWRGARVEHIQTFSDRHPNTLVTTLDKNHRSKPGITTLAQRVMAGVRNRISKPFDDTTVPDHEIPATLHLYESRSLVYNPMSSGYEDGLAKFTAHVCHDIINSGAALSDVIVLTRTNEHARRVRDAIESAGHPAKISNPNELDSYELKSLTSWLRLLVNPSSEGPIAQLARIPTNNRLIRDLSETARIEGITLMTLLQNRLAANKLKDARLKDVVLAYQKIIDGRDEIDNVDLLDRACHAVLASSVTSMDQAKVDHFWRAYGKALPAIQNGGTITNAIEMLQTSLSNDDLDDQTPAIEVSTLHGIKGRQKPVCIVSALADGIMPSRMALTAGLTSKEVEEERRLTYVAITRAQQHVHIISVANAKSYLTSLLFGPNATKLDREASAA
jgi:DNA helicase-2/ATP-dependent DNA helicase PcrA